MPEEEWVMSPEAILRRALVNGLISVEEVTEPVFQDAAFNVAVRLRDDWPDGEGFGSSDGTFVVQDFLTEACVRTDFIDGRLTRLEGGSRAG